MLKPPKLMPGDTLAAVSLSWGGPGAFPERYRIGKAQLEQTFGVRLVETRHALREPEWLARNPRARADDLMEAFSDPSIQGIVSTIGGDDAIRLLPYVDRTVIATNPKVFLGYSDTTVMHLACFQAALVSYYGPAVMAGFAENGGILPFMERAIRRTLFTAEPIGRVEPNGDGWTAEYSEWSNPENQTRRRTLRPSNGWRFLQGSGVARGPLIGGCLEVLEWLRGTPVWPDLTAFDGAMLFLETSEEAPPPRVLARALRTYAATGVLGRLSGLLLGRPGGDVDPETFETYDRAVLEVVAGEEGLDRLPIVTQMDFGHTDPMFVLPYGVIGEIDVDRRQFSIVEAVVTDV